MEQKTHFFRGKPHLLLHVSAWLCFLSFPVFFLDSRNFSFILCSSEFWFFTCCFLSCFYINAYWWAPYVIRKRKILLYVVSVVLVGGLFAFYLQPFDKLMRRSTTNHSSVVSPPIPLEFRGNDFPPPKPPQGPHNNPSIGRGGQNIDVAAVYIFLLVLALGTLFRITSYWMESERKVQQEQNDRMKAELSFLKAQVHPHFLFNTLNNIYSLALTNDPAVAESIYKLSKLMRYYMDEKEDNEINISLEIQVIKDFIALQKLRTGPNCLIKEQYLGLHFDKKIQPFILLPFIENAFKFGLSSIEECELSFAIELTASSCELTVRNSIPRKKNLQSSAGTGIKNTLRLLTHFYKDRFVIDIQEDERSFFVKLLLYI